MTDIEARTSARIARAEAEAASTTALAMALTIAWNRDFDLRRLTDLLRCMVPWLWATGKSDAAEALIAMIVRLGAFDNGRTMDPRTIIAADLAMHLDAGPDRREALASWLHQATTEEIASELESVFERLRRSQP